MIMWYPWGWGSTLSYLMIWVLKIVIGRYALTYKRLHSNLCYKGLALPYCNMSLTVSMTFWRSDDLQTRWALASTGFVLVEMWNFEARNLSFGNMDLEVSSFFFSCVCKLRPSLKNAGVQVRYATDSLKTLQLSYFLTQRWRKHFFSLNFTVIKWCKISLPTKRPGSVTTNQQFC